MQMENNEKITQFFNRIISHTNVMKNYGEKITDQTIVEKILRTLNPKFDHIVVAIEESKKLKDLKVEELQDSILLRRMSKDLLKEVQRSLVIIKHCRLILQKEDATTSKDILEVEVMEKISEVALEETIKTKITERLIKIN